MDSAIETLMIGGQARLPKELSLGEVFQTVVELDPSTNEVLDASFSPCSPIIERMLKQMMIGINLTTEVAGLLDTIEKRLHHRNKKAVITSIKDMAREYREYQDRKKAIPQ